MGLTFHRTFSLSRSSIAKVIGLARNRPGFKPADLGTCTDLGTIYQEAMPRYASRCGLLTKQNQLTVLGKFATEHDPTLEKPETQWLLHYHLAAPHGPTAFWHYLFCTKFLTGNSFNIEDMTHALEEFLQQKTGKVLASRSLRSTVTVFTGTYLKHDGLGLLGLLEEISEGNYRVPPVGPPPLWAVGYGLIDYWNAHYPEHLTTNLDNLTRGDFAAIFRLGEDRLLDLLLQLKREGLLDLYRISRPYQVVLLQPNPEYALQKMYEI